MDQYADGHILSFWDCFGKKTEESKTWLLNILRKHGCKTVLDVACGPGTESEMLVEEGFTVLSSDASDVMITTAKKTRAARKEAIFSTWEIKLANWLTLPEDIQKPGEGFDAVICVGNSLPHLPFTDGPDRLQPYKVSLTNIISMVRPGGILIFDHRNFDCILETGKSMLNTVYSNTLTKRIELSIDYEKGVPQMIIMNYIFPPIGGQQQTRTFSIDFYPVLLNEFNQMLSTILGGTFQHSLYGDFKPYTPGDVHVKPGVFSHVVRV
uniref:glycine N-methyltransferase-like n=1 Tax=Myxine glutinosa TaxID=7769 RepID=UPI00358EDEED